MMVSSRARAASRCADFTAPTLTGGARVEVCIAGAGLAGMIAAYLLAREKRSVMVIDEGPIGAPQPGAEIAQLAGVLERPYRELEERYGDEGARMAAQSFSAAIDAIEAVVRRERIACEFERLDGYCLSSPADARSELEREVSAALRAGMSDVELAAAPPIEGADPSPCVRYPGQALLHPGRFAAGLARAITRDGGRIHCGVGVRAVEVDRVATLLTSAGHRVQADVVVTPGAAGGAPAVPAGNAAHGIGLRVPRGAITRALYWDTRARCCARLRSQGLRTADVLLVAGLGDEGGESARHESLERWARRNFRCAADVVQRFRGEMPRNADMFAFAGRDVADSESLYVCEGGWGTPVARAAIAGIVIRDFVEGARTPWADPQRRSACYMGAAPAGTTREFAWRP